MFISNSGRTRASGGGESEAKVDSDSIRPFKRVNVTRLEFASATERTRRKRSKEQYQLFFGRIRHISQCRQRDPDQLCPALLSPQGGRNRHAGHRLARLLPAVHLCLPVRRLVERPVARGSLVDLVKRLLPRQSAHLRLLPW